MIPAGKSQYEIFLIVDFGRFTLMQIRGGIEDDRYEANKENTHGCRDQEQAVVPNEEIGRGWIRKGRERQVVVGREKHGRCADPSSSIRQIQYSVENTGR